MSRLALASLLALAACGAPAPTVDARAPELGKADGTDTADRACQVILRDFSRTTEQHNGYFVWVGHIDVATSLAPASVGALYRPDTAGPWFAFTAQPAGTAGTYTTYTVRVDDHTTPTPAMDLRFWEYQRAELAVYATLPDGSRHFDHNRVSSDFANYTLGPSDFAVPSAPGICPAQKPLGALAFLPTFATEQHGPLAPGGQLRVDYALDRLPTCRYSKQGYQLWDVEANVKFQPQGTLVTRSVSQVAGGTRQSVPITIDIPLGTQYVDIWFRNYNGADSHCEAFDSNYGQNYRFPVYAISAPVAWAGDWGGSFARDCAHRDGLPDPVVIDEYVRERACKFIDADVYVPGLTDDGTALRGERLWAELDWTLDGVPQPAQHLVFQGRVANNYRYRWSLPYDFVMSPAAWTTATYSFRFSHDGNNWRTASDAPRTIERTY